MSKIVILGAGSARFSLEMIRDACLTPGLRDSNIILVDNDNCRLEPVTKIAFRYARELDSDIHFSGSTDRKTALEDADFVINTALAGNRFLMDKERALQEEFGYYRGIGVNAPHRQLALMCAIAKDMREVCPKATFLQCANPVPETCTLMLREYGINAVGICHSIVESYRLAGLMGWDPNKMECTAVGINHCIWALELRYEGKDVYPKLREWHAKVADAFYSYWEGGNADYQLSRTIWDLFRLYGLFPIGDTCRASWPDTWWYHTDVETQVRWFGSTGGTDSELGHKDNMAFLANSLKQLLDVASNEQIQVTEVFPPVHSEWQIFPIIDSMTNNRERIYELDIPNNGTIKGLPDDFFVEVPVRVNANGFHPIATYQLPPLVHFGAIVPRWLLAERIIQAFQTGDIRLLLQTYLADHKTRSYDQALEALTALVNADWNTDMEQHYSQTLDCLREC